MLIPTFLKGNSGINNCLFIAEPSLYSPCKNPQQHRNMGPTNAQDRRRQFFRFLLLFLLAVAPITTVVYLYGRVDHVENEYLRSKYVVTKAVGEQGDELRKLVSALLTQVNDVSELATKPEMLELNAQLGANMKKKLSDLKDRIIALQNNPAAAQDSALKALSMTANTYHVTIQSYNDLYTSASEKLDFETTKATTCERLKQEWKDVAESAIERLPTEDRALVVTPE